MQNREERKVMGKLEGKVAFITGAARGQGRSHAIRLAQEGADIIAVDICRQIDSVTYPMSTPEDLAETVKEVEALDRRIFAAPADVRDETQLKQAFERGVAEIGPVDIVLANAGIAPMGVTELHSAWQDVIDVNLTGVNTPMIVNDVMAEFLAQDPQLSNAMANALPVDMVEPVDISNAILWLVSDDARYVTGVTLPVDAGFTNKK
jgi:NAD(P)-dependent dehydrogenase (short-subunit alcohol dehydrogenase family)